MSFVDVRDLGYSYPDGTTALREVSFSVEEGEMMALIGQNGSGKTTLSKCLNGLLMPSVGSVIVDGKDSKTTRIADMVRRVGYVFQNPDHQLFNASCREEIAYGPKNIELPPRDIEERVVEAARVVGLTEAHLEEHPFFLTKGLRQRVAIAAILALRPRVIIVDEPTTGQDARQAVEIMNFLTDLNQRLGHTIIIITHDMDIVARFADRLLVMANGTLIADGSPGVIFSDKAVMEEASIAPPQITRLAAELDDLQVPPDVLTIERMIEVFL